MTNPNERSPWDIAKDTPLMRTDPRNGEDVQLEPGVNFFVRALEYTGATTHFSCEGHPTGFYITFSAPMEVAAAIHQCGFMTVELIGINHWALRLTGNEHGIAATEGRPFSREDRDRILRHASEAWAKSSWYAAAKPLNAPPAEQTRPRHRP